MELLQNIKLMRKIITPNQAIEISTKLRSENKKIVLTGGCFDILHIGHITYLTNAKKQADFLFVFLESDENIKKVKGPNRPINTQADRAKILEHLEIVDYIIPLPIFESNTNYDELVILLKPAIIATTKGDFSKIHKDRQARLIGAKVVNVTEQISNQSTTRLVDVLKEI